MSGANHTTTQERAALERIYHDLPGAIGSWFDANLCSVMTRHFLADMEQIVTPSRWGVEKQSARPHLDFEPPDFVRDDAIERQLLADIRAELQNYCERHSKTVIGRDEALITLMGIGECVAGLRRSRALQAAACADDLAQPF